MIPCWTSDTTPITLHSHINQSEDKKVRGGTTRNQLSIRIQGSTSGAKVKFEIKNAQCSGKRQLPSLTHWKNGKSITVFNNYLFHRMSFPSGQSSLTMYAMLYLAVSVHVRSVSNDSLRSCFISPFYMSSLGKDFPTGFAPGIPSLPHRYPLRFPRTPLGFPAGNLSGIFEEVSSFTQQHWGEKNSRHTGSSTKSCFQKFLLNL